MGHRGHIQEGFRASREKGTRAVLPAPCTERSLLAQHCARTSLGCEPLNLPVAL